METADTSRAGIAKVDRSRLHPRRCKPGNRGREAMQHRYAFASAVVAALMSLQCGVVHALSIDLPLGDDLRLSGTLNTTVTAGVRSEEHTSELQSLMRISYAVFCLKKKTLNKESDI